MRSPVGLLIALAALAVAGGESAGAEEPRAEKPHAGEARIAIDLGGLDTRSAALMLSAQEAGDLEVSALAIPQPNSEAPGQSRVTLVVDVAGASLLEAIPTSTSELITEVYAYALDDDNGLIASLTQAFRLALEDDRPLLTTHGIKFFGDLELPPGRYSLRVLVLQRQSGRLGLRILPLEVPTWSEEPALLPPVRLESTTGWILVHAADTTPAFPLTVGGDSWVPSTRRSLDTGSRADILLLGRGLNQGLQAELLDANREHLRAIGLGDLRPATDGPAGLEALGAVLDAATLDVGEYRLRISTHGGAAADGAVSADSAPWVVRSAAGATPEAVAEPTGLSARKSAGRRAALERYDALRAGYHLTLKRLAKGEREAALEPLIEIESSRIGTGAVEEQTRLARAELEIARELSRPDPERLLTVIWIHEALYRHYHRQKRYLLATHSRQVVTHLAQLYLERDRSPRTRHLVACALVSLGGYLQETGALLAAESAYHDALAHDPDHPAALLGLATIQESYGQYEGATELLGRLHKAKPADTHVRLRLGVNLRRLDKAKRAVPHLEGAISETGPDWVAAVAAQELASLHASEKRLAEAVNVLEKAVERHPEVQRLRVQLSAMLDHTGKRAQALAVLDRLDPTVGSDTNSPRLIYSRANTATISAVRRTLAEEANRGLAALSFSAPSRG